MKKLLLVDGNSVLFRAYYATAYGKPMTSKQGVPTNAVFGFANMLQKAIDTIHPDAILVAFDAGKHTFRHDLYADYKGGRKPAPDDLVPQFGLVRDYLDGYHIRWVERPDIEADDLIGSISAQAKDYATTILTSDRDLLQLIDDTTTVLLMKKGLSEMDAMTSSALRQQLGIVPSQIIDLKGLMGDSSDNIPGIPGIGEKTALKLLAEYETVENVLSHEEDLKGALAKKVSAGHDSALLSKQLATIKRDVDLDFGAEDCTFLPNYESLVQFLRSLDMNSLVRRYEEMVEGSHAVQSEEKEAYGAVSKVPSDVLNGDVAIYLDANLDHYMQAELYGFALANATQAFYIPLKDAEQDKDFIQYLKADSYKHIGFDIKRNMHLLDGTTMKIHFDEDAMILATLVDSSLTSTEKIYKHFGLYTSLKYEDVYGKPSKPKLVDVKEQAQYACENAKNIWQLYQLSMPKIEEYEMTSLYRDIELPLSEILYDMEKTGIVCDCKILEDIAEEINGQIQVEQEAIYAYANYEFNINSPKQLAEVLYDDLELPSGKKRSTSADILEKLEGIHPIIAHILTYRKLQKLYSTYAEGLQKYIDEDGKIHTVYNQCATQTGRLSSSEPNLQNISVRDEQGRLIRKAFLPTKGNVLISSDYHQIELRILAHMADEDNLIAAFNSDIDIHTKTAMDVFGIPEEEVDSTMRRKAKAVNFGIVYGISDFGLAAQIDSSRKEASEFIESYYRSYPKIKTYMNHLVESCQEKGYVTTLCGRRRDIPEIHDKNHMVREFGKRAAMNAPIQGSAADLIKIAMIRIDEAMKKANVKAKMILQVHDELIFDVPKDEVEQMKEIIHEGMTHAMTLKVPLTAECAIGSDWYEAK